VARPNESEPVEGREPLEPAAPGELTAADSLPAPEVEGVDAAELPELPEPLVPELFECPPLDPFELAGPLVERAATVTVPCMFGWIKQTYEKVPGLLKVWLKTEPGARVPESKSLLVTVWPFGSVPVSVQVTVSPALTVIAAGLKA
jgi:hypothetical protein